MGFKSEGKKMRGGRGLSFSFGVPTYSFLCLRNPGTRVPGRKAKVRFRLRGPERKQEFREACGTAGFDLASRLLPIPSRSERGRT
jgi:hypothetical protein